MCKMHTKGQGFTAYITNNGATTTSTTECVGCQQPGDRNNMVRCRTCPLAWHRTCLLNWATASGGDVVARIHDGVEIECTACSYLRPKWRAYFDAPLHDDPPFSVPTPSRLIKHNALLFKACADKKDVVYGNDAGSPSAANAGDKLPPRPPPTVIKASRAEANLLAQGKLAKGTTSALRDDAIRNFKGVLNNNIDGTDTTPDRQIGNIFSRPPGSEPSTPFDTSGLGGIPALNADNDAVTRLGGNSNALGNEQHLRSLNILNIRNPYRNLDFLANNKVNDFPSFLHSSNRRACWRTTRGMHFKN